MQQVEHELHQRRRSRNLGLLFVLLAFVALVFGLSVVKITQGDMMEYNSGAIIHLVVSEMTKT